MNTKQVIASMIKEGKARQIEQFNAAILNKLDAIIALLTPPEPEEKPSTTFLVPDGMDAIDLPKELTSEVKGNNGDAFLQGDYREVEGEIMINWRREKAKE